MRRAAAVLMLALAATACGPGESSVTAKRSLRIGVKADQPGLGLLDPKTGRYSGFDVDVATYVAGKLGVPPERITFKTTPSSTREKALAAGTVDMIFASYSITPRRKTQVTFGGPYYVAHQDTLVRADDRTITNVRDLAGKRICAVSGSNSWKRVTEERAVKATPVEMATYSGCIAALAAGRIDALSTDDLILAGYAAGTRTRVINAPFTDEKYGVGLRKGDLAGCEAVNRALTAMYQDGTAARLLERWFGHSGLKINPYVPQFEGCS
ncbi:transporter substrate-binding domain-containing protein [Actinomadura rayongensis]|uniref:Transporter substrate-binding domain-containing protein n=2 Tax=Actinomadura rayongensis TaxID=1429076 RepID=A0A6I4WF81_9ACTN|nr:transporter substrate-binding domain-containing protein [Actinomadura rayongensis]